jgi:hypothetical protein
MTPAQVKAFKQAYTIEEGAKGLYYAAVEYHGYEWPLWQSGRRCHDSVQHARQQKFRRLFVASMRRVKPGPAMTPRVLTDLRGVMPSNVIYMIEPGVRP